MAAHQWQFRMHPLQWVQFGLRLLQEFTLALTCSWPAAFKKHRIGKLILYVILIIGLEAAGEVWAGGVQRIHPLLTHSHIMPLLHNGAVNGQFVSSYEIRSKIAA